MSKKKPMPTSPRVQKLWKYCLIIGGREVTYTGRAPDWCHRQ